MSPSQPRWKLALFDLDGTLVDTIDLIVQAFQHAYREVLDRDIERDKALTFIGLPLPDVLSAEAPGKATELADSYHGYVDAHHDEMVRAFGGMPELVVELAGRGMRTAVVTAKHSSLASHGLEVTGYPGTIPVVAGMEDTVRHKPEPDPLLAGLAAVGLAPSDAVYIGDAVYDLQAAAAVPMDGIGVSWGAGDEAELAGQPSLAVVDTPAELRRLLLG